MKAMTHVRRMVSHSAFPAVVLFAVVLVVISVINPRFMSAIGMSNFFSSFLPLALAAMAISVVLIGGGIDLSIGATMSLVNVVFITLVMDEQNPWVAFGVAMLCAVAIGAANGALVAIGRIPPLLATLGMMFLVGGIALTIMPIPTGSAPIELVRAYASSVIGIPVPALILILVLAIWWGLSRTTFALRLYAVGGDPVSAFATGLSVAWTTALSYICCSVVAGFAALALTANVATGGASIADTVTLGAIAAAVIGGVSLLGGSGSPVGAAFGALFLGLISSLVLSAGVPSSFVSFVTGAVVLFGIVFTSLLRRRRGAARADQAPQGSTVSEGSGQ